MFQTWKDVSSDSLSGPSCSKLITLLVNEMLTFQTYTSVFAKKVLAYLFFIRNDVVT